MKKKKKKNERKKKRGKKKGGWTSLTSVRRSRSPLAVCARSGELRITMAIHDEKFDDWVHHFWRLEHGAHKLLRRG